MKFYHLCSLCILFFQSFLCHSMDENLLKMITTKTEKISFPEPYRQQLSNDCAIKLANKKYEHLKKIETQEAQEILEKQKKNLILESHNEALLKKIEKNQQENELLQKKLALAEKKLARDEKKKGAIIASSLKQPMPDPYKELTGEQKTIGLRLLKKKYQVKERIPLIERLKNEADQAYYLKSPTFDLKFHIFRGTLNAQYRFAFCPCTSQLIILDHRPEVALSHDFICSEKCTFYDPKNETIYESDVSSEIDEGSDSDEIPEETFLTKAQIETMC